MTEETNPLQGGGLVARLDAMNVRNRLWLTFALGLLSALSLPPLSLFPVFILIVPLLVVMIERTDTPQQAGRLGYAFGLGHFLAGLYWVGQSFLAQDDVPQWMAPFAVLVMAMGLAMFMALAFFWARWLWRKNYAMATAALPSAISFAMVEWLRGHVLTGFPWNLTASIWAPLDIMMQPLALIGAYGLGLVTLVAAAWLSPLFGGRGGARHVVGSVAVFVGVFGVGYERYQQAGDDVNPNVTVRLVQPNIPQVDKWRPEKINDHFATYLDMSHGGGRGLDGITHVIWPETAIPYFISREMSRQVLVAHALDNRVNLIAGARRLEWEGDTPRLYNSVHMISPDGRLVANYDKAHLVPFGEYLPLRGLLGRLGLGTLVADTIDYSPGVGPQTLSVAGTPPFGPLICYEVIFPGHVASDHTRPEWLVNLTNDGWFGTSSGPYQHLVATRMRAVEEGLPIVRSAGTGISAVIDAYGRVVTSIPLNTRGYVDASLPAALSLTPYARWGDSLFAALIVILLAKILILPSILRRRAD